MSTRPSAASPNYDELQEELDLNSESGTKTQFRECVVLLREELLRRAHADRYEATVRDLASAVGYPESVVRAALEAMQHDAPRLLSRVDAVEEPERWRVDPPRAE